MCSRSLAYHRGHFRVHTLPPVGSGWPRPPMIYSGKRPQPKLKLGRLARGEMATQQVPAQDTGRAGRTVPRNSSPNAGKASRVGVFRSAKRLFARMRCALSLVLHWRENWHLAKLQPLPPGHKSQLWFSPERCGKNPTEAARSHPAQEAIRCSLVHGRCS